MKSIFQFLCFLVFLSNAFAQSQQDVYPDNKGTELMNLLVSNYKTTTVLSYNDARDQLWGALAKRNHDSLKCVYTGYTIYINPSASNPRTEAYNKGLNCEHTWPQSLGAEGQAKSDMHHLFPTREDVNAVRGNLPFNDIPDHVTAKWYRLAKQSAVIPSAHLEEWSELDANHAFEVREDHKGNVARSVFYFFTMYKDQSEASFFTPYMGTLYQWHYEDPVDAEEEWRENFIAGKQGGKHNPFILDSTLIRRAYFPNFAGGGNQNINEKYSPSIHIYPNPFSEQVSIQIGEIIDFRISLFNTQGIEIFTEDYRKMNQAVLIDTKSFSTGIYVLKLEQDNYMFFTKIILSR